MVTSLLNFVGYTAGTLTTSFLVYVTKVIDLCDR